MSYMEVKVTQFQFQFQFLLCILHKISQSYAMLEVSNS